jgi:hypothetical protein
VIVLFNFVHSPSAMEDNNTNIVVRNMVVVETGWDGVRREENIGMLINSF